MDNELKRVELCDAEMEKTVAGEGKRTVLRCAYDGTEVEDTLPAKIPVCPKCGNNVAFVKVEF